MPDETLIEPFAVQEFFVDGFDGYEVTDGVLKCAGYRLQRPSRGDPIRVVVVRIVMPLASLGQAIENALSAANVPMPAFMNGQPPRKHLS